MIYDLSVSMTPAYRHSLSSLMPQQNLNEDQLFSPNHQASSSFSSLSSYPILFNPQDQDQDQEGSYCWEPKHLPSDEETGKIISSSESWDNSAAENRESSIRCKLTVWKKENKGGNLEAAKDGSVKWMSSKNMGKTMVSDQTGSSYIAGNFEDQKQPLSPLGTDNSTNNYSNHTVRVCADCHTTKTPLWRSGPTGPKTLCNACGIRQRKARRAMAAAAASANGTIPVPVAAETSAKGKKFRNKEKKKSKIECAPQMKKKRKLVAKQSESRKKFSFEDLTLRLSKNVALKQVFPQEEKEAAILLMALSYGLLHGRASPVSDH